MSDYWFARRFPVGDRRNSMAPVSREGWLVSLTFVAAVGIGGVLVAALMVADQATLGIALFAILAGTGATAFIVASQRKGDKTRTVADYRKMRN
jgi:hypothetical protein